MKTIPVLSHPALLLSATAAIACPAAHGGAIRFNRDIRPIMSDTCFHCHGPDKNARKGDLRLDQRDEALKPAKSGAMPIVPGKPDESEVIKRLFTTDEDDLMPPEEAHKALTPAQKELFRQWIAEGATYEAHWAYTPLVRPPQPPVKDTAFVKNPVDAFIVAALEPKGLPHSPEAGKARLLRRLSLDLTGLPPSPAEVDAFVQDTTPGAYDDQVRRLLDSPHFGERMAVWWLDVARFTDTVGFHGDQNQRIFPYRDYVIQAFNANLPFDRFTLEQIAGDLLPNPSASQLAATGFNRLNMMTREGGAQPKEYLAKYGAERVRTVGSAWLGSTFACAECHDHKFDPIPMKDFYSLQAFFADVKQWGVYADYGYTPNPDLRGFTNDHPFPPEVQVESPYLQRREARLRQERANLLTAAAAAAPAADFDAWRTESAAFFAANPSGWAVPIPHVASTAPKAKKARKKAAAAAVKPVVSEPEPATTEEAEPFDIETDGRVVFDTAKADETTLSLPLKAGWLSALRLELLPHESHKGSILRSGGQGAATVRLGAALRKAGQPAEQPLAVLHAEPDRHEPRYANGEEILGVQGGWRTAGAEWNRSHSAEWVFQAPVRAAEGDVLIVKLPENTAGCVRVSISPFAPAQWPSAEWMGRLAQSIGNGRVTDPVLAEAFITGSTADGRTRDAAAGLLRSILECRGGKAWTMITAATRPLTVRILPRGNWMDESGAETLPATPSFLPGRQSTPEKRLGRLDLARWLCSTENGLTPRAVMNRLWKQFFGNGLSASVDDLGAQGEPPSHPELLDWLAAEFRDSGWNFKHMIGLMVRSSTYRQDSSLLAAARDIDPANRLLSSQNPRRLDAEFVRDNALFIAGRLNLDDIGGPSVKPYQPAGYYANLQFPDRDYIADIDDRQWRRGVYMHWQRTFLHPMLANFDAPMRDECAAARIVSNTPQQALTLLNDPTFVEAARILAARILAEQGDDPARIATVFRLALSREPRPEEAASLTTFLASQRDSYRQAPAEASKLLKTGLSPAPPGLDPVELAAWTSLSRVVLNLQETITRY